MKLVKVAIIIALILGLLLYTSETMDVVKIVGKHSIVFLKGTSQELYDRFASQQDSLQKPEKKR